MKTRVWKSCSSKGNAISSKLQPPTCRAPAQKLHAHTQSSQHPLYTHWHRQLLDIRCTASAASAAANNSWAQVAASIQKNLGPSTSSSAAAQAPSIPANVPASSTSSSASSGGGSREVLEGRRLNLQLGTLPLIEQRFTVGRSHQTSNKLGASAFEAAKPQEFRLIAPEDVDQVLDVYIEHDIDGDPFWTRAWPSAVALAAELLAHPELVRGKRVADLGCGLGLAGLAAALAGAKEVILLDRDLLALQCALLSAAATLGADNVKLSGLRTDGGQPTSSATTTSAHPSTHPSTFHFSGPDLDGYLPTTTQHQADTAGQEPAHHNELPRIRPQVFDWNAGPDALLAEAGGKFDVVLACDVLYEETAVEPIASLVPRILKPLDGLLLLGDPPNRTAHNRERFVQLLLEAAASSPATGTSRAARVMLESCALVDSCHVKQLDPEMAGGMVQPGGGQGKEEVVPVQLMKFRSSIGTNTVGIKLM